MLLMTGGAWNLPLCLSGNTTYQWQSPNDLPVPVDLICLPAQAYELSHLSLDGPVSLTLYFLGSMLEGMQHRVDVTDGQRCSVPVAYRPPEHYHLVRALYCLMALYTEPANTTAGPYNMAEAASTMVWCSQIQINASANMGVGSFLLFGERYRGDPRGLGTEAIRPWGVYPGGQENFSPVALARGTFPTAVPETELFPCVSMTVL